MVVVRSAAIEMASERPLALASEVIFFGSAAVALFAAGQRVLGVAFALVFVLNNVLVFLGAVNSSLHPYYVSVKVHSTCQQSFMHI